MAPNTTPSPDPASFSEGQRALGLRLCAISDEIGSDEAAAEATKIAVALFGVVETYDEWVRKERQGPVYPEGMKRDSHPESEGIWRAWWEDQLSLCARCDEAAPIALRLARGEDAPATINSATTGA